METELPFFYQSSIVVSGCYKDDEDGGDSLTYTGQGGCNLKGNMKQHKDQTMTKNNLALRNNAQYCIPVRVIRTYPQKRVSFYDGLYDVKSVTKVRLAYSCICV